MLLIVIILSIYDISYWQPRTSHGVTLYVVGQRQGRGGYSDYTKRMLTLCDGVNININPDILPGYFKFSSEDDI